MTIAPSEVAAIRARIARAHALAAERFRAAFASGNASPTTHLELLAAALVECSEHVRVRGELRREDFSSYEVERTEEGVFEYWLVISEILASPAWHVTKLVADHAEYDAALGRMQSPQIVRAIPPPLAPRVELRADGTALLDVTVHTRAGEERIERRTLVLDRENEFHFHGRVLLAEGRGGVKV